MAWCRQCPNVDSSSTIYISQDKSSVILPKVWHHASQARTTLSRSAEVQFTKFASSTRSLHGLSELGELSSGEGLDFSSACSSACSSGCSSACSSSSSSVSTSASWYCSLFSGGSWIKSRPSMIWLTVNTPSPLEESKNILCYKMLFIIKLSDFQKKNKSDL